MHWIDGHLDLAYLAVCGRDLTRPAPPEGGCITLPALRVAGVLTILGTIFTEPDPTRPASGSSYPASDDLDAAEAAGQAQVQIYEDLEAAGAISIVRRRADLEASRALPRIVLLMEGADPIRAPEDVPRWFERGLRMVGLTWAAGTRYAGGNRSPGPLTPLGRAMVGALDAAGIAHDASHLADEALDGLLECATGRIVATHSNCRALMETGLRHLRDDHIRAIGERHGIVGLNLFSKFLVHTRRATVADCVRHVEHVCEVMGHRRGVALGSDMDGGFAASALPEGLDHPGRLGALADALEQAGWSESDIQAFKWGNWHRLLESILPR